MCCKRYHIIFSTSSLKFKCKACVEKEVIIILKITFGHVTREELIHFKKMVRVCKTKLLLFCLRYDPLRVFRRQNHIAFIFMKTTSHDLLVQMAYSKTKGRLQAVYNSTCFKGQTFKGAWVSKNHHLELP